MNNPKGIILGLTIGGAILALVSNLQGKDKTIDWTQEIDIALYGAISMMLADVNAQLGIGAMTVLMLHLFLSGKGSQAVTGLLGVGTKPAPQQAGATGQPATVNNVPAGYA